MSVYLFIWFYLSCTIIHICNGSPILSEPADALSLINNQNQDHSFDEQILDLQSLSLEDSQVGENKPDLTDLLSKLRDNWEAPSIYLEKRGYLTNSQNIPQLQKNCFHGPGSIADVKSLKDKIKQIQDRKVAVAASMNAKAANNQKFNYLPPANQEFAKETGDEALSGFTQQLLKDQLKLSEDHSEPSDDPIKSNGFLSKVKNKFQTWFQPGKTSFVKDDVDLYNDIIHEEAIDNVGKKRPDQKFFDFKYDDSWLREGNLDSFGSGNIAGIDGHTIKDKSTQPCSVCSDTSSRSKPTNDDLSAKLGDVLQNLTQADMDYVKSFLKCYKENKAKFFVDYLHMNKSQSNGAGKTKAPESNSTESLSNAVKVPEKTKVKGQNATTTTTTIAPRQDDSVKLDIEIKTNEKSPGPPKCEGSSKPPKIKKQKPKKKKIACTTTTTTTPMPSRVTTPAFKCSCPPSEENHSESENSQKCPSASRNRFDRLLKFLAHQHHSVDQVGKLPHKPLNLDCVQQMIDSAHETLNGAVLHSAENSTKCTPIDLNEASLDSGSKAFHRDDISSVNENKAKLESDVIRNFLADSPIIPRLLIGPPYADNFLISDMTTPEELVELQQEHNELVMKKKREIPNFEEQTDSEAEDEDSRTENKHLHLAPLTEALNEHERQSFRLDDYLDDYGLGELRERKSNNNDDESDYEDDNDADNELFGRKKKKRKKKKKYNKKNSEDKAAFNFDFSSSMKGDPAEFTVESDILPAPHKQSMAEAAPKNEFMAFSELNDIKFHVSPQQEEDIEKFIQGMNTPPQVFNFDVEKYVKPRSNAPPLRIESQPQKTFYEFIPPPAVENEQVPLIIGNSAVPESDFLSISESSGKESRNTHGKRDILRQYIKGLSDHLHDMYGTQPEVNEENHSQEDAGEELEDASMSGWFYGDVPDAVELNSNADTESIVGKSDRESFDAPDKRDLLRQYIKGLSGHTGDILQARENSKQIRSEPASIDRDQAMASIYANNLDVLNYGQFVPVQKESVHDEFVDNFYLLNDGSSPIYGAADHAAKPKENLEFDPMSVGIDLDLERKFKDLTLGKPELRAHGKCSGMDCGHDKMLDMTNMGYDNMDMYYLPYGGFHREVVTEKSSDSEVISG